MATTSIKARIGPARGPDRDCLNCRLDAVDARHLELRARALGISREELAAQLAEQALNSVAFALARGERREDG